MQPLRARVPEHDHRPDRGYQLYQNRELDELELSESTLTTITSDTSNAYNDQLCEKRPTKYAYDFHFNFYCLNTDGTPNENWNKAVANRAFRRCFQEGLNLIPYYARFNKINPSSVRTTTTP